VLKNTRASHGWLAGRRRRPRAAAGHAPGRRRKEKSRKDFFNTLLAFTRSTIIPSIPSGEQSYPPTATLDAFEAGSGFKVLIQPLRESLSIHPTGRQIQHDPFLFINSRVNFGTV
jgi:hypothetical protein